MWYIHTVEYSSVILRMISCHLQQHGWICRVLCLVKLSQAQKTNSCVFTGSKSKTKNITKQKQTQGHKEPINSFQRGRDMSRGKICEWD